MVCFVFPSLKIVIYFFLSVTAEALRLGFLNGSRERFALGNDVLLRLFVWRCLVGLACRDDIDVAADADLFGTGNFDAVALVDTVDAVTAAAAPRFRLLLSLRRFKLAEIGVSDTLRRLANGVALGEEELFAL